MLFSTIIIYSAILFISYILTRDIFHPSVIVCGMWTFLLVLYQVCDHPLWSLSDDFFIALSLWVIPFVFFSLVISKIPWKIGENRNCTFNLKLYNKIFPYVLLYVGIYVLTLFFYVGGLSIVDTKKMILNEESRPFLFTIFLYLNVFLSVYVFYGILNYKQIKFKRLILLVALLLIVSLFKGNKTSFLSMFVGVCYALKYIRQFKFKYFLFIIAAIVGLLILVSIARKDYDFESDSAIENFFYIYFLSPLTSFDLILHKEYSLDGGAPMSATFSFFYKLLNAFGTNFDIAVLGEWVYVPLPNNVFTTLRPFYVDGGLPWIGIMACVLGTIWGFLYYYQKKGRTMHVVFYALMVGTLFFQSFDDYFFRDLSLVFQNIFFIVLIVRGFKFTIAKS